MTYIEEIKKRVELCNKAEYLNAFIFHARNLIEYLDAIDSLVEEKRMVCEICKRPLYQRQDGSLTCIEMHH